ncbi:DUF3046 domain-containing protein [Corynebacterium falsenii]|uniref:DUF3046 domain-containing protein n=1 Tax=Corynebacterium falsenii TaxID=108486 RepID=A0A418Q8H7_9CORY|nr:DUF3046 domain-containing protein [Corynebacterium falsenii]AHI03265.1 hypothetical protein CFAL_06250 [Corynebacterium falsenii DSM 44353]MDC7103411.1 DUF3046 domain-containing protein [Corynebacterium falsenii]RIX35776.1 DUF3046 domain-containing protein [Corynebacterium falsenii]UBI03959.1 DUF3046 domain-containing protein [Corynebacterium falsenii]UBI06029.1 DUF3046 domain-containing protein [Corynebacterium falsenii]
MRRTEFDRLVDGEFGSSFSAWIGDTHVLSELGDTAENLIERGVDPRDVWLALCDDFDVPAERRLGEDI